MQGMAIFVVTTFSNGVPFDRPFQGDFAYAKAKAYVERSLDDPTISEIWATRHSGAGPEFIVRIRRTASGLWDDVRPEEPS